MGKLRNSLILFLLLAFGSMGFAEQGISSDSIKIIENKPGPKHAKVASETAPEGEPASLVASIPCETVLASGTKKIIASPVSQTAIPSETGKGGNEENASDQDSADSSPNLKNTPDDESTAENSPEEVNLDELSTDIGPNDDLGGKENAYRKKYSKMSRTAIPETKSTLKLPPLHAASQKADLGKVKLLLKEGADPNQTDRDGNTPMHWAVYGPIVGYGLEPEKIQKIAEVIQTLLNAGAKVNAKNNREFKSGPSTLFGENTPLHYAVINAGRWNRDTTVLELLLEHGADVKSCNSFGRTPFHETVFWSFYDTKMPEILLQRGSDINAKDDPEGSTTLHMTSFYDRPAFAEYLISKGADVHIKSKRGNTPLHEAVRMGRLKIVTILVEKGALLNAVNKKGKTPLALAVSEDKEEYFMNEPAKEARRQIDQEIIGFLNSKGAKLTPAEK